MIPYRYKDVKYEDAPENIRLLFEKMVETRKGLYIHGAIGCGKTHIAYALYKETENILNKRALFENTTELLMSFKKDFDRPYGEKSNKADLIMENGGLLFLDDIGVEKMSEWVSETFYLIVNRRYNDNIPIIFTSNLSIPELSQRIGDRIVSRIAQMCDVVELSGGDRRIENEGLKEII